MCFHVRRFLIPRIELTCMLNRCANSRTVFLDFLMLRISSVTKKVFGCRSPNDALFNFRFKRPLSLASFAFIFALPKNKCFGSTHARLSHVWQTNFPFGSPLNKENETRCALRGVFLFSTTNCPYPFLRFEPVHSRHFPTRLVFDKNLVFISGVKITMYFLKHLLEQTFDVRSLPYHGWKSPSQTAQDKNFVRFLFEPILKFYCKTESNARYGINLCRRGANAR